MFYLVCKYYALILMIFAVVCFLSLIYYEFKFGLYDLLMKNDDDKTQFSVSNRICNKPFHNSIILFTLISIGRCMSLYCISVAFYVLFIIALFAVGDEYTTSPVILFEYLAHPVKVLERYGLKSSFADSEGVSKTLSVYYIAGMTYILEVLTIIGVILTVVYMISYILRGFMA